MQKIEVDPASLCWPSMCCRCGSSRFSLLPHSEDVVVWTLLGITKYRTISFDIPVCATCARGGLLWYAGAVVLGLIGYGLLEIRRLGEFGTLMCWAIGIVCAFIGTRRKPLRILGLEESDGLLRLGVYNERFAAALRRRAMLRKD